MLKKKVFGVLVLLFSSLLLSACGSDDSNAKIAVDAGQNLMVNENQTVEISGTLKDPDMQLSEAVWEQRSGIEVDLINSNGLLLSFIAPSVNQTEILRFEFSASTEAGKVYSDTLDVTVLNFNQAPQIILAASRQVAELQTIALQAQVSDADSQLISYQWRQILSDNQTPLNTTETDKADLSVDIPALSSVQSYQFELSATDEQQATSSKEITVNAYPALQGRAVDDPISQSTVSLKDWNSGALIAQTQTDELGYFEFLLDTDSRDFLVEIDGGQINGEAFVGRMNSACEFNDRRQCNVTPISSLILSYAARNDLQDLSQQGQWISDIEALMGNISPDPFLNTDNTNVDVESLRAAIGNQGENLQTWLSLVIDYLNEPNNTQLKEQIEQGFNNLNFPPSVEAGSDQTVNEQSTVVVSASASDSNGPIASYAWTQLSGTEVTLNNANSAIASFTSPTLLLPETLVFQITVTDNKGDSATDTLSVSVNPINTGPIVTTGADQSVNEQTSVMLTVNASDADGNIASYTWTQLSGTNISLSDANTAIASFTSPTIVTSENLVFQVLVTDNEGVSQIGLTQVTVNPVNAAPTVSAGNDQTIDEQNNVSLNATANDTDGSIATYQWQQTAGVTVSLQDANTANASFIAPEVSGDSVVQLEVTVTDNEGISVSDNVSITIANNFSPTADIIAPVLVRETELVVLDGSGSSDTETASLQYQWQQTDNSGISIAFADSSLEQLQFTAPNVTTSIVVAISLTVSDEGGKTATNQVSIALTPSNTNLAPINDTGISTCADYAFGASESHQNSIDCNLTTDADGDSVPQDQDGHVGRDINASNNDDGKLGFSFIKLDSQGQALNADATSWSCVLDTVTELIWEVKTTDSGLQDIHHNYSWLDNNNSQNGGNSGAADAGSCVGTCDTESYVNSVNALSLCGLTNWRVPAYPELQSLVDYSQTNFAIENDYFPNTDNDGYWTSSTLSQFNSAAWRVNFNLTIDRLPFALKSETLPVRLVHDLP
ncbi:PKD domain-containing protein [Agarivorans sp. DSG3-1]|uniref:PKD domain-containing protein n=1 Tax=Agarivorans sp. DSG3-1 TaxID=3342249 RepID=UPI00398F3E6F